MMNTTPNLPSSTEEALTALLAASGKALARWLEDLTPEQRNKFGAIVEAGSTPVAQVVLAPTGPTVGLYVATPDGGTRTLCAVTLPASTAPLH